MDREPAFCHQTNFLELSPILPRETNISERCMPLINVIRWDNFVDTIDYLGRLYLPKVGAFDIQGYMGVLDELKKGKAKVPLVDEAGFGNTQIDTLPDHVRKYFSLIQTPLSCLEELRNMDSRHIMTPVSFFVGTESWKNDIFNLTSGRWNNLITKSVIRNKNDVDLNTISMTRVVHLFASYNYSGGVKFKEEVFDSLTSYLYMIYWTGLKKRAKDSLR